MNRPLLLLPLTLLLISLAGCNGGSPVQLWDTSPTNSDEKKTASAERQPLATPPELAGEISLPNAAVVASNADGYSAAAAAVTADVDPTQVAVDAYAYSGVDSARLFSAAIDGMTSLNIPIEDVDSPSGIIVSDWIRDSANSATTAVANIGGILGNGDGSLGRRYRFVVRVFKLGEENASRLEIRTVGQSFINNHWVNKPISRKVSNELFAAVGEQINKRR